MSFSTFTNIHKKYSVRATIAGIFGLAGFFILISVAFAAPNPQINYQGKITNSSNVALADGSYQVVFSLYTVPTGGTAVWTETRNGANEVALTNGLFSVMLGSVTSLSGIDFNQTLYLGVTFEADSEMLPRKILGTVPAAFEANNANTVGGVASTSLIRNDQAGTITGSTTAALFSIIQNGTGSIFKYPEPSVVMCP